MSETFQMFRMRSNFPSFQNFQYNSCDMKLYDYIKICTSKGVTFNKSSATAHL